MASRHQKCDQIASLGKGAIVYVLNGESIWAEFMILLGPQDESIK